VKGPWSDISGALMRSFLCVEPRPSVSRTDCLASRTRLIDRVQRFYGLREAIKMCSFFFLFHRSIQTGQRLPCRDSPTLHLCSCEEICLADSVRFFCMDGVEL